MGIRSVFDLYDIRAELVEDLCGGRNSVVEIQVGRGVGTIGMEELFAAAFTSAPRSPT